MARGNPDNLNPIRTKDEARKRGQNGGKKSGDVRRRTKDTKEALLMLLDMPATVTFNGKKILADERLALAVAAVKKAKKGDIKAQTYIRDTIGDKPTDKVETDGIIKVIIQGGSDDYGG